jgi:nucleoprotein TPR
MIDATSLERQNKDLTEQCRALLRAVEEYRQQLASPAVQRAVMMSGAGGAGAGGSMSEDGESMSKGADAQSYITKQLLTFRNVDELQEQNQKLLKVVRQLSTDMDREAEVRKEELRAEYGRRIEDALREVHEIRSEREVLEAKNRLLAEQRDMYRILLAEADRSYIQTDEDAGAALPDTRASAGGAAASSSDSMVSPSAAARARNTADAVRKIQQELNEQRDRSEGLLAELRAEASALREDKTRTTLACAQAQSDCSFLKERLQSLNSTSEAQVKELNALRDRTATLQAQLGASEKKLSEHVSEALSSKQREQQARESLLVAESGKKHAEERIVQLEADLAGLKSEKTQIHNLMAHVKTMHEEDAKRYSEDLARVSADRERKEKDWTEARGELAKERSLVDELRITTEHKLSELRGALRKSEMEASELRTEKTRLEADVKAAADRAALLERQLESAETRFRDALAYQQRAAELAGSPKAAATAGAAGESSAGSRDETSLTNSRLLTLESENASLQKQLEELKMHRDNWHTMAKQNEDALREVRADMETRRGNADKERASLEALLAEKTQQLAGAEQAAQERLEKIRSVEHEHDVLKQQVDMREGGLRNSIRELELERNGLKERLAMADEEAARLDELRRQALADYERQVSLHAAKLEEMREVRAKLVETQESSRQAVAAAEERWSASAREAEAEAEGKRLLDAKLQELQQQVHDLEERNSLLDRQLQQLDKDKEARLQAVISAAVESPAKAAAGVSASAEAGDGDTDAEKQFRDMREHLRRLKHKADLAEYRLLDAETELAREKQRAEQQRREVGELRARLEMEESRNASALSSEHEFQKLKEQVQSLSVFKESNAHLRAEAEETRAKAEQSEAKLKLVEAQLMPLQQVYIYIYICIYIYIYIRAPARAAPTTAPPDMLTYADV